MKKSTMKKFSFLDDSIIFKYMNSKHTFSKHIHEDNFMIGTPIKGKSLFIIKNKEYIVDVGDLCIIPSGVVHSCTPLKQEEEWKFLTFHPSINILQNIVDHICNKDTGFTFKHFFIKDLALSEYLQNIISHTLSSEHIDEDKLLTFLNILFEKYASFDKKIKNNKIEKFEPLFKYLKEEEYCLKNLDFHKMAEIMNMNPYYFHRLFSKTIGLTPQTYINALRVSKATTLLFNRSDSLTSIAQECGFYDQAYFSKQFKKYYGITPTNYKQI